jgi:surfactin family lipopeptide synthetase C
LPPIGHPIDNAQIYLLNPSLQPVPVGIPGELYIGGICLGRGYHNQVDLTAERFIPNPFSSTPGGRLYKTGDIARYRIDGDIEFLGRADYQIKLRGYRIELGEIETLLLRHPMVRESVALIREDVAGDRRLVAYLVLNQGEQPTISELRQHLQLYLPDYMIPSIFVVLEALPLTPNKKIDRKALPAPDIARPDLNEHFVAPSNPIEAVLAKIWAEVLRIERVGINDNFFEVGGHSLLATQVISRIYNTFLLEIAVRSLFDAPTIRELAEVLVKQESVPGQTLAVAQLQQKIEEMSPEEIQQALLNRSIDGV